jgi:hypothetical protein
MSHIFNGLNLAFGLHLHLDSGRGNAEHRDKPNDFENREISATQIHGSRPEWTYGGGAHHGAEGAF